MNQSSSARRRIGTAAGREVVDDERAAAAQHPDGIGEERSESAKFSDPAAVMRSIDPEKHRQCLGPRPRRTGRPNAAGCPAPSPRPDRSRRRARRAAGAGPWTARCHTRRRARARPAREAQPRPGQLEHVRVHRRPAPACSRRPSRATEQLCHPVAQPSPRSHPPFTLQAYDPDDGRPRGTPRCGQCSRQPHSGIECRASTAPRAAVARVDDRGTSPQAQGRSRAPELIELVRAELATVRTELQTTLAEPVAVLSTRVRSEVEQRMGEPSALVAGHPDVRETITRATPSWPTCSRRSRRPARRWPNGCSSIASSGPRSSTRSAGSRRRWPSPARSRSPQTRDDRDRWDGRPGPGHHVVRSEPIPPSRPIRCVDAEIDLEADRARRRDRRAADPTRSGHRGAPGAARRRRGALPVRRPLGHRVRGVRGDPPRRRDPLPPAPPLRRLGPADAVRREGPSLLQPPRSSTRQAAVSSPRGPRSAGGRGTSRSRAARRTRTGIAFTQCIAGAISPISGCSPTTGGCSPWNVTDDRRLRVELDLEPLTVGAERPGGIEVRPRP